jgi:hypothetical protein
VSINTKDAALFFWSAIRDYYAVLQDQFLVKCLKCLKCLRLILSKRL